MGSICLKCWVQLGFVWDCIWSIKSSCNTSKISLKKKKKNSFSKKIKSAFKGLKNLKIIKTHFWQKLKNKFFFDLKTLFMKRKPKKLLFEHVDPEPLSLTAILYANCSQSWSFPLVSVLKITWSKDKTRMWKSRSTYWSWTSQSPNKDLLDCQDKNVME